MKKTIHLFCMFTAALILAPGVSHAGLPCPGAVSDLTLAGNAKEMHGPTSVIKNLDDAFQTKGSGVMRDQWIETELVNDSPSGYGQGKVDMAVSSDGVLWAVFFDDRNAPSAGDYYIRKSTDGGVTWVHPFPNNGFSITNNAPDNPSLAVHEISGTTYIFVAVTGVYNGYNQTFCHYKPADGSSWNYSVAQSSYGNNFRLPRLCFAGNRLIVVTVSTDTGNYYSNYSDNFGASWNSTVANLSYASYGFAWVTQPDLVYDADNSYLFCAFAASLPSTEGPYYDEDRYFCLLVLSTNNAASWKRSNSSGNDIGPWSVGSPSIYSYEQSVVEVNHGQTTSNGHWLIVSSVQENSGEDFDVGEVYGDYSQMNIYSTYWNPGTTHPLILFSDTDGDEAALSLTVEPGAGGRFCLAWVDDNTSTDDEVYFSYCLFSDLSTWLTPDPVSIEPDALPNTHFEFGQGASTGIQMQSSGRDEYPVVCWVDSRNSTVDIYSAYYGNPPATATPASTGTPSPTATQTGIPTSTPTNIPTTSGTGLGLLLLLFSAGLFALKNHR